MRDRTSPTRKPPRAMQMIWLKLPSRLVDLEREALDQRVVLVPADVQAHVPCPSAASCQWNG